MNCSPGVKSVDRVIVIVCKCFVTKIAKRLEYYGFGDMFSDIKLFFIYRLDVKVNAHGYKKLAIMTK